MSTPYRLGRRIVLDSVSYGEEKSERLSPKEKLIHRIWELRYAEFIHSQSYDHLRDNFISQSKMKPYFKNFNRNWRSLTSMSIESLKKELAEAQTLRAQLDAEKDQPDILSDYIFYPYWLALPSWTLAEAAALAVSADPKKITRELAQANFDESLVARKYLHILDIEERAVAINELAPVNKPLVLIKWLIAFEDVWEEPFLYAIEDFMLESPSSLAEELRRKSEDFEAAQKQIEALKERAKKRSTLHKIVASWAYSHGWDPAAGRSTVPSKILNTCQLQLGPLAPSDDTIRAVIKEACTEFPRADKTS